MVVNSATALNRKCTSATTIQLYLLHTIIKRGKDKRKL